MKRSAMIVPTGISRFDVGRNATAAKPRKNVMAGCAAARRWPATSNETIAASASQACRSWPDDNVQPKSVIASKSSRTKAAPARRQAPGSSRPPSPPSLPRSERRVDDRVVAAELRRTPDIVEQRPACPRHRQQAAGDDRYAGHARAADRRIATPSRPAPRGTADRAATSTPGARPRSPSRTPRQCTRRPAPTSHERLRGPVARRNRR